jgi:hypothetical protein
VIPGSNLFNRAARLIRLSPVDYYAQAARSINATGQWIATYNPAVPLPASVQAVPRDTYVQKGLDLQRNYVTVFAAVDAVDLERDAQGDRFVFDGREYQLESENSWYLRDGWAECLAVEIGVGTLPIVVQPNNN